MQNLSATLSNKNAEAPEIPYTQLCQCMFYVCSGQGGGSAVLQKIINVYNVPLDIRDGNGATPLHVAVAAANVDAVRTLLHAGSPVNLRSGGKTPVQMCANNPKLFGIFRMQAIQCIAEGKTEMFTQLVQSGIPAARTADDDQSLLHWAATFAKADMVGVLINSGANVNAVSAKGETALHLAVREGDRQCAQILLRAGADADLANRAGKSARDMDKDGILRAPADTSHSEAHRSDIDNEDTDSAQSAEETTGHDRDLTVRTHATDSDSHSDICETPEISRQQSSVAAAGSATPQLVARRLPWLVKMLILIPWYRPLGLDEAKSLSAATKTKAVTKQLPFALRRRREGNGATSKFNSALVTPAKPTPPPKAKIMDWTTQSVTVKAGQKFQFPINIDEAGSTLRWSFETKGGDIAFGIGFNATSGGDVSAMEMPLPPERKLSHVNEVTASWKSGHTGVALVIWDNSFSWYTDKELTFSLQLQSPPPKQSSTEHPLVPKVVPSRKTSPVVRRNTASMTPLFRRVVTQTRKHRSAVTKLSYWQRERSRMHGVVKDLTQQLQTAQRQLEDAQARCAAGDVERTALAEDIAHQCMERLWQRQDVNLMDFVLGKSRLSGAATDASKASLALAFKILSLQR